MYYFTYFIDEQHYTFLELLSGISEISDITEAKDTDDLLTSEHWVDILSTTHVFSDDTGSRFTEAKCQESTNFNQSLLEHDCF